MVAVCRRCGAKDGEDQRDHDQRRCENVDERYDQAGEKRKLTIKKGIKACGGANPSEAEVKELLAHVTKIVELEEKHMGFVIERMVKKNLEKSEGRGPTLQIVKILAEKSAPGLKPEIQVLEKREAESVKKTLDVYAGATGGEDQIHDKAEDDSD